MKNSCRHCGAETVAALCWTCVKKVQRLCERAHEILPLMRDEIAKETAKAPIGSGGGGDKSVISVHALETRDNLRRVILLLQDRAGCRKDGKPETLAREAYGLQKHRYGQSADDPLYSLVEEFQDAVKDCWRTVDAREDRETAGKCVCGETLRKWRNQTDVVVCHACRHISTVEEAKERMSNKVMDGLAGQYLTPAQSVDALSMCDHEVTLKVVEGWARHKPVAKDGARLLFDDVLDLAERRTIKRNKRQAS